MVYVHVPFCKSFCAYCAFYSEILSQDLLSLYTEGVVREAKRRQDEIVKTLGVNTLYFGGGTPSLLRPDFFARVLEALSLSDVGEFTVEVNPDDVVLKGEAYLRELLALGVNRVSMGIQSLDDGMLRRLGRRHDGAKAIQAFRTLRRSGVENVSVDLIFGIGGMSMQMLSSTLDGIIALQPDHISAYQLSIEEDTPLEKELRAGRYKEPSDQICSEQYYLICERLGSAGFHHYEISSWARPGREAVHNSAYWTRAPYVGLGPGAHSLSADGRHRSWNSSTLPLWTSSGETLTPAQIREESIMLGLRTDRGCDIDGKYVVIPEDKWFVSDGIIADLI